MGRSLVAFTAMVVAAWATLDRVAAQPADDHLIIPNKRAGLLRLGMPASEVLAAFGQPQESGFLASNEGYLDYYAGGGRGVGNQTLSAMTWGPRNEVFQINVHRAAEGYATFEGVKPGMPELNVRLLIGQPKQRIHDADLGRWALYYPGMVLYLDRDGMVDSIALCLPRYQHRGQAGRRWCY